MKISYNWLKDYLSIDLDPSRLSEILTSLGLEVEGMEEWESVKGGMKGVVIGEVLTCKKHPDADKLSVTTVSTGSGEPLNIVCGAPNVAAGQKVAVAPAGTTLYKGDTAFELKKTKIRGEISEGMICAEDELGIGTDHQGIIVLDNSAVPGTPAADYFGIVRTQWRNRTNTKQTTAFISVARSCSLAEPNTGRLLSPKKISGLTQHLDLK